jgi:hypothetical protein
MNSWKIRNESRKESFKDFHFLPFFNLYFFFHWILSLLFGCKRERKKIEIFCLSKSSFWDETWIQFARYDYLLISFQKSSSFAWNRRSFCRFFFIQFRDVSLPCFIAKFFLLFFCVLILYKTFQDPHDLTQKKFNTRLIVSYIKARKLRRRKTSLWIFSLFNIQFFHSIDFKRQFSSLIEVKENYIAIAIWNNTNKLATWYHDVHVELEKNIISINI